MKKTYTALGTVLASEKEKNQGGNGTKAIAAAWTTN